MPRLHRSNVRFGAIVTASLLVAATTTAALAQPSPAPPPRVIGAVQVDSITSAPQQLIRSVALDATPQEVFDVVTDHAEWPKLMTMIESVSVVGDGRQGSQRTFATQGGAAIAERIVAYDEPGRDGVATFAYSVGAENPFGVQGHLAVMALRPGDAGGTVLDYHQLFDHPDAETLLPMVAQGTEEILANLMYRFGGEPRGATDGLQNIVIAQRRVVTASSDRTWQVLGEQWGDVDAWASTVSHSTVKAAKGGSLVDATRSCEVPGQAGFRETMLTYDEEALTLSYQVIEGVPPFVTRAVNTWRIEPLADDRVVVTSRIELATAPGTPQPAIGMVKGQFTQLIDLSFDELVHFVEHRRPHPRKVAALQAAGAR